MFAWDDLRLFLAVARVGTTLGAARQLGTSQPTVVRRVASLERSISLTLFDRRRTGYALTEAGRELLSLAENVEREIHAVQEAIASRSRRLAGTVRVTAPEPLANAFLAPAVVAFHRAHPEVEVQLLISDRFLDLAAGEADVALRATINGLENSELIGRKVAEAPWAVYCSRSYAGKAGIPTGIDAMDGHSIVGGDAMASAFPALHWLEQIAPGARVVWRSSSLASHQSAVRAGLGLAALPCLLGRNDPDLVRCFDASIVTRPEIWIVAHPSARRRRHIKAFMDALTAHVIANAEVLRDG